MNDLIKGLTILKDYPGKYIGAREDAIYVNFSFLTKEDFDVEDIETLEERYWEWQGNGWCYYV